MSQNSLPASGASFTAATARSPSTASPLPRAGTGTRTIVETPACPTELKRGAKGWSLQDLKVQRVLGEGALSTVVHCVCSLSGLPIALKMYHRDKLNPLNVKQVGREIEIHASLNSHPNVIKLYAAFEDADGVYLVQEFAAGGDLYAELARHGGYMLEAHVVKHVMGPFLGAMAYLHARGVLHRDIKPENILLTGTGELRLADFGLAIDTSREKPMSRVGTLDYMPPEIANLPRVGGPVAAPPPAAPGSPSAAGARPSPHTTPKGPSPLGTGAPASITASPAAPGAPGAPTGGGNYGLPVDVWCTGILAYELLVGGPPFEADTKEATYTRILKTQPQIPALLSSAAQDFIQAALQKDPAARPTIQQLAEHPWVRPAQRPARSVPASPVAEALAPVAAAAVAVPLPVVQVMPRHSTSSAAEEAAVPQPSPVCAAYAAAVDPVDGETAHAVPPVPPSAGSGRRSSASGTTRPAPITTAAAAAAALSAVARLSQMGGGVVCGAAGKRQSFTAQSGGPAMVHAAMSPPPKQTMRQNGCSPVALGPTASSTAVRPAPKTAPGARASEGRHSDLIAASYGDAEAACTPAAMVQVLARPPAPAEGSTKSKRRPRILSAYLKKLNLSGFMGLGGSSSSSSSGKEGATAAAAAAAGEPHIKLSRLGEI